VKLAGVELRRVALPLVTPFRTSFGVEQVRDVLLVRAVTDGAEGWGECVAAAEPRYSSEYADGAADVLRRFLVPAVAAAGDLDPEAVGAATAFVKGHRMAKAALELAVLDAWLRERGQPLPAYLGATRDRVPAGVSVGIMDSVPELVDAVAGYLDQGYLRIKLKIEPGWDLEPVAAVRERFGDDLLLQVDANAAYTLADAGHLAGLDRFGLLLIEQHLEARRLHDACWERRVPLWCGGMLETGIGRAANVALAALPGFTLPGDTSASDRYYRQDLTAPFVLTGGHLEVPTGPGIGVEPIPEVLEELTTSAEWVPP
jgi:O-succinylbenzoate synthase